MAGWTGRARLRHAGLWIAVLALAGLAAGTADSRTLIRGEAVVTIGPNGFSPRVLRIGVDNRILAWQNDDSVPHTIRFGSDGCAVTLRAGARSSGTCRPRCAGTEEFQVSGFERGRGKLVAEPTWRAVSLRASRIAIRKGESVILSGKLDYANASPPTPLVSQPVVVRRTTGAVTRPIARVMSNRSFEPTWRLELRPAATATYRVSLGSQPQPGCTTWVRATSRTVTVVVR